MDRVNSAAPPAALTSPTYHQKLQQCVHCGLCLPACPTYTVFGTEMDSPRGRIALMHAAADGRISLNERFEEHITLCLACRACETACPSGVQYGDLVETARIAVEQARVTEPAERLVRWAVLYQLLPHVNRLRWLARLLKVFQVMGLHVLVRRLDLPSERLHMLVGVLPPLPARYMDYRAPAPATGKRHGTVAFFHGCVQEAFLAGVNRATVRVLQRNGYEAHVPSRQTCCGAAALHVGEEALARRLARRNVDAFMSGDWNGIINNAGGCGATLKQYDHLLKDDPDYAEKAATFVARVYDVTEFLAPRLHVPPKASVRRRVTYVDSCHLRHGQGIVEAPRTLLQRIPGLELVEVAQPDHCCGSAGVYNIAHPEVAHQILDAKMDAIAATGADTIVTTNPGCHFQIQYGIRRAGLDARVAHVVELLDEAYKRPRLEEIDE